MTNDHLISTLNDLIQISKDGEKGFRTCADDAQERYAHYREMFTTRATECAQTVLDLQDLVHRLGGEPANHSTFGGTLHRQWVNLKAVVTGHDDESILNECERGEDAAVHAYRKALSQDLPNDVRLIIERQYQGALANHDKVRALRNQVRARKAA
ncbi:PA2169 family four-helix-bundle protein [Herbaspirillum robiniae]|uniref:Aldehyde dehydrogenase n=1 Tax=Herbaspirillum robiniae TaxID=2014887 RepID=A0A246WLE4_9BURK|nr:PA2169 family four-helix-bundle protein [Herbaspirillum robiniae]NUU02729.1 PA2169 family four-helix-bundle protein [Herbaspirillum robiniae]OWY27154.1 aldehyde dehydrogenase [Herbaspirillum robiniae]